MFRAIPFALMLLLTLPPGASAHSPSSVEPITVSSRLVSGGAGNQTDPHLSGSLVAFTALDGASSEIRYADLAAGTAGSIPNDGHRDSLPDVSGSMIVFRRTATDGTTTDQSIFAFDTATPGVGPREVAPSPDARRALASVGGDTVAFMQFDGISLTASDVCVASLADISAPAVCIGTDTVPMSHRDPDVSSDGSTVAWTKCRTDGTACDVWVARKGLGGTWGVARQLTDSTGEDIQPSTDGQIVTYASNAGGNFDIWWESVEGTDEHQLVLADSTGSIETNPNVAGGMISFERELVGSTNADLYALLPATNQLYQLTSTVAHDETLHDLQVGPDGRGRIVWAQPDGITRGQNDIHTGTFSMEDRPDFAVCPLFDQTRAFRLGATVPVKLQLCDAAGANLSSADAALQVTGLVKRDASAATGLAEDSGNANPDSTFRFSDDLDGYIYNLATRGLSRGTWEMHFTVTTDPGEVYRVTFDLR